MNADPLWVVDRMEGDHVVLLDDEGREAVVPRGALAVPPHDGMVLRLAPGADWAAARHDPAEEQRRRDDARARMERLRGRDPGGDITL
jgi:hypothetical protein